MYLHGKESCSCDPYPAVQGVEVGNLVSIVITKHSAKPNDWQYEGEEHQSSMQQFPGKFILTPGQGDTVQHSSYRGGDRPRHIRSQI